MIVGMFLAAQAMTPNAVAMQSSMRQLPLAEAVGLFKRVCFDPFPDPKAALAVIADPELQLSKLPETPSQAMQPGDAWASPVAQITYVDADWLPRDFGTPQCGVTVVLEGNPEHLVAQMALASALALQPGKGGKSVSRSRTQWDIPSGNDMWRLFLRTETTPSGKEMNIIIMTLGGKAKK